MAAEPTHALALRAEQRAWVAAVMRETLAGAKVYAFGSRATGRARPHSDLDLLVVRDETLSLAERAALRDRFENSELPFRVDVVEEASLSGPTAARVALERVPL